MKLTAIRRYGSDQRESMEILSGSGCVKA